MKIIIFKKLFFLTFMVFAPTLAVAQQTDSVCAEEDKSCLFNITKQSIENITETLWRDQSLRELAKLMASQGRIDDSISLIETIENPDTKAMTIRGIAMAAAENNEFIKNQHQAIFTKLRAEAEKISDPPSYAIALTYIAMAQAFAGDNEGAMTTTASMENSALRNKAYAESAEIQAEKNNPDAAMRSIEAIDNPAFRDKAHRLVSKIFAEHGKFAPALAAAQEIKEPYNRAQAMLYILAQQILPQEVNRLD